MPTAHTNALDPPTHPTYALTRSARIRATLAHSVCRSKFEIDFVDLSYCNQEEDLYRARAFLDGLGMQQTKLVAKARVLLLESCWQNRARPPPPTFLFSTRPLSLTRHAPLPTAV